MNKISKVYLTLSFITTLFAILITGIIIFWSLYPYKTVVFNKVTFPVEPKTIKAGNTLTYTVDYCKYTDIVPTVTRYIVNGIISELSTNPALKKEIGCAVTKVQIVIPETTEADTYFLKMNYEYQVNPIRKINVIADTEKFVVTK